MAELQESRKLPKKKYKLIRDPQYYKRVLHAVLCTKNTKEAYNSLRDQGIDVSMQIVQDASTHLVNILETDTEIDRAKTSVLDSLDLIKDYFRTMVKRLNDYIEKFEKDENLADSIMAIRELREWLTIGLKRLGEMNTNLEIKADNITVNSQQILNVITKTQESWFEDMGARREGNTLIFTNPTPEMLDTFERWKIAQAKKEGIT